MILFVRDDTEEVIGAYEADDDAAIVAGRRPMEFYEPGPNPETNGPLIPTHMVRVIGGPAELMGQKLDADAILRDYEMGSFIHADNRPPKRGGVTNALRDQMRAAAAANGINGAVGIMVRRAGR